MSDTQKIVVGQGEATGVTKMSVNQISGRDRRGDLCVILGRATGIKTGEDKISGRSWSALTGDFYGKDLESGKSYRSGKLFLPAGVQEAIEDQVRGLPPGGEVKFGIGFRRVSSGNPSGYAYETVNVLPTETVEDPMAELIGAAKAKVPELAKAPEISKVKELPAPDESTAAVVDEKTKPAGKKKSA